MAEDDIEECLYAFEMTATTAHWPQAQWVMILEPYLTSPAQIILKTIPAQDITNYEQVKAAILDCYRVMEDTQQQHFQGGGGSITRQETGPRHSSPS